MVGRELPIAIGKNRWAEKWKNGMWSWDVFAEKVQAPVRDTETMAEYEALSKTEQDNKKDKGGFIAGVVQNGTRKNENITWRSIIVLDADNVTVSAEEFSAKVHSVLNSGSWLVYSTRKHRPTKPRLRLCVAVSRNITGEEYNAVARKIASLINFDWFDETTYQAARLMYWPSISYDAEFYFHDGREWDWGGEMYSPDTYLNMYMDWRDHSQHPMSCKEHAKRETQIKQQQDPLEKSGMIGTFCRLYSIEEAIDTFIPGVYEKVKDNRWTYAAGSTVGGMVTYDNKWAYSNHATDPAGCTLCNSFDLIRLHKFGNLDTGGFDKSGKPPSYKAMLEFMDNLNEVKVEYTKERFSELEDRDKDTSDENWRQKLNIEKGKIVDDPHNIKLILKFDPRLKNRIVFDEMSSQPLRFGLLPWDADIKDTLIEELFLKNKWSDFDMAGLRNYLHKWYDGIRIRQNIDDAFREHMLHSRYNPLKEYLMGLAWDGVPRLDNLLIDYFGADDNVYTKSVTRKMLVGAIARVFQPGCKMDNCLVLSGNQGCGKSYFIRTLGGKYFTDGVRLSHSKQREMHESIAGYWIVEIGELASANKLETEDLKAVLSKQQDVVRVPYATVAQEFPRCCVFFGTTNDDHYLRDSTGGRRFWPVGTHIQRATKNPLSDQLAEERDQIWAEAKHYYQQNEPLFLSKEVEQMAQKEQRKRMVRLPYQEDIEEYLEMYVPEEYYNWSAHIKRSYFLNYNYDKKYAEGDSLVVSFDSSNVKPLRFTSTKDIWGACLGGAPRDVTQLKLRYITEVMNLQLDWRSYTMKGRNGKPVTGWGRKDVQEK